ncbi:MAG: ATP-dependent protease LonB [Christensenellales bacterium]|jgi:Lon-like ATP-dependent protease
MSEIIIILQVAVSIIIGLYFLSLMKGKKNTKASLDSESKRQMEKLNKLRTVSLNVPLSEKTRPTGFDEIIGQNEGIVALCAALCGENPQHVLIYGPPGVGKTCAARLVMDKAKKSKISPFKRDAKFIELDATCIRYDERNIADPLIGCVHDPIYQGAGAFGAAGIPQPKEGAVTKAHGGILFLDEIGELHPFHINKLLKVLEDRCVYLESAYYNPDDKKTPRYIHDIFAKGLPADFRLVGATTKSPREISPAIRSRCMEIFFRPLFQEEIVIISKNAAAKAGYEIDNEAAEMIGEYAANGREAVNMIQMAAGVAREQGTLTIQAKNINWVVETGKYVRRPILKLGGNNIGCVNGLAVYGSNIGTIIEIETVAVKTPFGSLIVTGLIDEEEMGFESKKFRRKSTSKSSVENVLTALKKNFNINPNDYYIHINLPGSAPIDGPSAGIAIAVSVFSAITGKVVCPGIAMTGEISINGCIRAVGGIKAKVLAAKRAGATLVIVPMENISEAKMLSDVCVIGVNDIHDVMRLAFSQCNLAAESMTNILSAKGVND